MATNKQSPLDKVRAKIRQRKPRSILRTPKQPSASKKIIRIAEEIESKRYKTEGQVSRVHLLALRNADHIEFKYVDSDTTLITCFKDISQTKDESDIISWSFKSVSIVWNSAGEQLKSNSAVEAKYVANFTSFDWEIQTIIGALELGDDLEFIWFQDSHTSFPASKANIHIDSLKMIIYRNNFRFHFLIGIFAGNDEVRMIKVK